MNTLKYIALVRYVCNKYKYRVKTLADRDEIFSIGLLTLVRCLPSYNPDKGSIEKFIVICVARSIRRYLGKNEAGIHNAPDELTPSHDSFDSILAEHHKYEPRYFDSDFDDDTMNQIRKIVGSRDLQMLMLHYNDGLTMEAIIKTMNLKMTRQGVHYTIKRAKEKIRKEFIHHQSA